MQPGILADGQHPSAQARRQVGNPHFSTFADPARTASVIGRVKAATDRVKRVTVSASVIVYVARCQRCNRTRLCALCRSVKCPPLPRGVKILGSMTPTAGAMFALTQSDSAPVG
ncbi:unnamed protein product, partial [Iphiclides podalirius]